MTKKNYAEFMVRFEVAKEDVGSLKKDLSNKETQSKETIENLVAEYSLLAAEVGHISI